MSSLPPTPPPGPPQRHPMRRFLNFWFAAADPTVLGFIRVVTGCLVIYVHAAYTPDLDNFFGVNSWYDLEVADRERREVPSLAPSLEWEHPAYPERGCQVPEPPPRRDAAMAYLDGLVGPAADVTRLDAKLAFLERFFAVDEQSRKRMIAPGGAVAEALEYQMQLASDPRDRADQLAVLADESLRRAKAQGRIPPLPVPATPSPAQGLSPEDRKKLAQDAEAFYQSLPDDRLDRTYVLEYLYQIDHFQREAFLKWVRRVAKLAPDERFAEWAFLAFWNVDKAIVHRFGSGTFSVWFHLTDPTLMRVAHGLALLVFVLFTLGVCTRVTSVLTWLIALSYLHRTMQILFGMDTMMNIALMYLMIGDSGAALSVDRMWRRYRAARQSLARHGQLDEATRLYLAAPPASVSAGFALRLLQVHFCFIYMASGLAKLKGGAWWNANAYWDTLANPEFTPIYYHWYEAQLRWLVSNRAVYGTISALGVGFTFVAEIGLPFLVWTRLRPLAVVTGVMLHTGIAAFMGLVVFSLFMLTLLLSYVPGVAIRSVLFGEPKTGDRLRVRFHAADPAHRRAAALLATFDLDGRIDLATGPTAGSLVAETPDGPVSGPKLATLLTERVPTLKLLKVVFWLPAVTRAFTGQAASGTAVRVPAQAAR